MGKIFVTNLDAPVSAMAYVGCFVFYAEIEKIAGLPIDHSFLTYKKELIEYGYKVGKISMKEQKVMFEKVGGDENEIE